MGAIITLSLLAILVLYLGIFKMQKALLPVSLLGLLTAGTLTLKLWGTTAQPLFSGMVLFDHFSLAFSVLMIVVTILVMLLSRGYFDAVSSHIAEYYALIIFSLTGALLVVSYHNLSMLFIGIEIMSVALYILAGIRKKDAASNEAALKYFLMGAFSTGFLLFGITLLYGATATFDLAAIRAYVIAHQDGQISPLFYTGILLLIVGLAFKVGAAPFHFWTPDVYEGAPILITTFMSTVVKTAAFAGFLRIFLLCFDQLQIFWAPILLGVIVITLFVGNISALVQQSFKRMLAYSSISHAGYMLFAVLSLGEHASGAMLVYAAAYSIASVTAFAILVLVKRSRGSEHFESFNGLAKSNPFISLALTLSMLSLAGIPLTAGFIGKFMMFSEAVNGLHITLVILAAINAAIGIFYYFHVIINMYFKGTAGERIALNSNYKAVLLIGFILTILIGIYPNWLSGLI
ncbi:NADH-quinone oxidoreductase subunit N [Olivibacter sp. SDN3]|uniref:NADH-quinone oxidoreductase subunit N n=1 Tax=Olivibacter sp. SDN3 TaxID=2764720 RepID=UPI001650EF38|nr:NADH-quinone oxidoreductase subunit N [Olivibacter sp. SDN3]QNL51392.1 NADH-quinone oxidoreductase subunit N [Olivibacter sp. SDN3]